MHKNKQTQDTVYPKTPIMSLDFLKAHILLFFPCVKQLLEVNLRGDITFKKIS